MYDIEFIKAITPLIKTILLWGVIITAALCFRKKLGKLVDIIIDRIRAGNAINAWGLEIPELDTLEYATPANDQSEKAKTPSNIAQFENTEELSKFRNGIYAKRKGVFLVHAIEPSKEKGQIYDIFIYLFKHKSDDLSDVVKAEFFLGHYWGNQIFTRKESKGKIGLRTSAYGPFLCICKVTFIDGTETIIERYIDFEMGKYLKC